MLRNFTKGYKTLSTILRPRVASGLYQSKTKNIWLRQSSSYITDDYIIKNPKEIHFPEENFFNFIEKEIAAYGDRLAMVDAISGSQMTYTELLMKSRQLSYFYKNNGYKQGDCVAIHVPNCIEYPVTALGTVAKGITLTTANPTYTAEELSNQLRNSNARILYTKSTLLDTARRAAENTNTDKLICIDETNCSDSGVLQFKDILKEGCVDEPVYVNAKDDVAYMMYSSGTTGLPKGVMMTHHNMICNTLQLADGVTPHKLTKALCVLPMFHIYGLVYIMFVHLVRGFTLYTLPSFDPETFLSALQNHKIEKVSTVPPIMLFLLNHPMVSKYDVSHLRNITVGAAPVDENVLNGFHKKFPNIHILQGYGMTESMVTHMQDENAQTTHKHGSAGTVVSGVEWKVQCLETGKALPAYEKGEVCTRGPQVMKGYHNNEEETKKCLSEDGWMRSGDLGYYDEDFHIFVVDRLKELIKCKGFQVAPAELEDLLHGHEDITDSCVIGVPDEKYGEVPRAFVVKKNESGLTEEDVYKFVNQNVSDHKQLRGGVKFVDALPRSPAGKLLRRVLKEEHASK
ncbi:uncharacterized protein LOC130641298 [Hydractinia symbiolongicarpus]|uniref:uncharacterized protein LOC130641298 n=1 Tax=Hydractinia symbiolongicarpus TaxID=13093 RepID=UPI00254DB978|nr:uncharacterized protein LOC130641298 [Hydractinia symbiolongicarpus]XP_057304022.1 uncharacterized protein LOC130641298 [Hydractinia symbiolongicarpus]